MTTGRSVGVWLALGAAATVPLAAAAMSPLLAWRQPVYIVAGFAGIVAMVLLLVQALLAGGVLPGFSGSRGRRAHRWVGAALVLAVVLHVGGLWITSPPDVIDALLFVSPTLFSPFGVIAMWAVFAAALLAAARHRARVAPRAWRLAHTTLAAVTVLGSAVHAMLIEGTMETVSKIGLCGLVIAAAAATVVRLRVWRR